MMDDQRQSDRPGVPTKAPNNPAHAQTGCPVKLGGVLSLTGSLGAVGKPIAETARMAVEHVNAAGGHDEAFGCVHADAPCTPG